MMLALWAEANAGVTEGGTVTSRAPDAEVASRMPLGPPEQPWAPEWLASILAAIHEGMLVLDLAGRVLHMNQAFTDLFGFDMSDAPIGPPYPWWPTEAEDAEQHRVVWGQLQVALAGVEGVSEFQFYDQQRRPVWVECADAHIIGEAGQLIAVVRTFRDITGRKNAQTRRAAAVSVSADLAAADDLETVLTVARHGFELLFDGSSTTQLDIEGERHFFSGGRRVTPNEVTYGAQVGLNGTTSPNATTPRPGLLLVPQASTTECRIWVHFGKPRRIDTDEMIAADLFAQAFGLAVDRIVIAQQLAANQDNLVRAIGSHRQVGQAVGILVERYRITPAEAFQRLRQASQNRNLKVREIAARMIETGLDPDYA